MPAPAGPLSRSSTAGEIVAHLRTLASEENRAGMKRYGIRTEAALGISNPDMRKIARTVGRDHARAHELWATGIREARMLALLTADPARLTADEARRWAGDFASWEIVDAAADLFVEARLDALLVPEFADDGREFVRRAAFAMIAGAAFYRKKEPDAPLLAWLPLIGRHAGDDRNFVRKSVNWALRNIGKRNVACHPPALALARKLAASDSRAARWIGKDAVRELTDPKQLARLERRRANALRGT